MPLKKKPNKHEGSNNMRRKIIGLLREFDPATFERMHPVYDRQVANMPAIEAFVLKHGYLKKHLNEYTYEQLPDLVSQMEKINQWYTKNLLV